MQIILMRLLAIFLMTSDAFAGRAVTGEERTHLVAVVKAQGCSGGKIEFDDGKFEVDDAIVRTARSTTSTSTRRFA